jgi:fumarylacetoacetase
MTTPAGDDPTTDPALRSWVPVPDGSDFPIQNLPWASIQPVDGGPSSDARLAVAIGEHALDVRAVAAAGLLGDDGALVQGPLLTPLLAAGRPAWTRVRRRLAGLLTDGNDELRIAALADTALVPRDSVAATLPVLVGDYVDFYSSLEHATNLGRLFRPDSEPLLPNWRHLPVGYHGRSGTVVSSGSPIPRPCGQRKPPDADRPVFGPSVRLDIELELGFLTGGHIARGHPVDAARAPEHLFGVVLVNDWSARDIQAWEYQPLGPFLGKSFATTVSPWVVTLDALAPFRVPAPVQEPPPFPHLAADGDWGLDIDLTVELQTAAMAAAGHTPVRISATNAAGLYWTMPQQLAHACCNGASVRPGDLFATGTISGSEPGTYGSLIELTWGGRDAISLPDGSTRTFLEDGDIVVLKGSCGGTDARPRLGFGACEGRIDPAVR